MTILPYKGKSPVDAGIVYCPYVPLQFVKQAIQVNSIKLVYDNPDFNPRVKFRPRHCVRIDPNSRVSTLTKLKFFRDAIKWCKDNAGNVDTDWVVDGNFDRVWFREQSSVVLFKLTFDGFDKT